MSAAACIASSYCGPMAGHGEPRWPEFGRLLLAELATARDRYALVDAAPDAAQRLVERLSTDLHLRAVSVGAALGRRETPPSAAEIEAACADATVLTDLDVLLWPAAGVPVLAFLARRARTQPTIAVWPGTVADGRARYSRPGRPDHHDRRLADVVVLRPRPTRYPDEVPFEIERIVL